MNIKFFQIMLVVIVVLSAAAIFGGIARGPSLDMAGAEVEASEFEVPGWLDMISFLGGGPQLSAADFGSNFKEPLTLRPMKTKSYPVSTSEKEVRRVRFQIKGVPVKLVEITYQADPDQRLNDKLPDEQKWYDKGAKEPDFVVYSKGGTFSFYNKGMKTATITLED